MKDEQKKDLKFIVIFVLILTISFAYLTQTSLAKYRKQTSAEINTSIAKWNIKVNKEDISNKITLTNKIIPIIEQNEFVKEGVIAPGTTGYCDIVIDATQVDVDFKYQLNSAIPTESNVKDLKVTDYIINPSSTNQTKIPYDDSKSLTGIITKNTTNNVIRLYIKWEEANGTMNNQQDTEVAINSNSKALININLKFEQKTS